jgi:hypothetical protein
MGDTLHASNPGLCTQSAPLGDPNAKPATSLECLAVGIGDDCDDGEDDTSNDKCLFSSLGAWTCEGEASLTSGYDIGLAEATYANGLSDASKALLKELMLNATCGILTDSGIASQVSSSSFSSFSADSSSTGTSTAVKYSTR